eukprot:scaffold455_cov160-Pinguiococcus_pyrenoidosus.AAC.5
MNWSPTKFVGNVYVYRVTVLPEIVTARSAKRVSSSDITELIAGSPRTVLSAPGGTSSVDRADMPLVCVAIVPIVWASGLTAPCPHVVDKVPRTRGGGHGLKAVQLLVRGRADELVEVRVAWIALDSSANLAIQFTDLDVSCAVRDDVFPVHATDAVVIGRVSQASSSEQSGSEVVIAVQGVCDVAISARCADLRRRPETGAVRAVPGGREHERAHQRAAAQSPCSIRELDEELAGVRPGIPRLEDLLDVAPRVAWVALERLAATFLGRRLRLSESGGCPWRRGQQKVLDAREPHGRVIDRLCGLHGERGVGHFRGRVFTNVECSEDQSRFVATSGVDNPGERNRLVGPISGQHLVEVDEDGLARGARDGEQQQQLLQQSCDLHRVVAEVSERGR